MSCWSTYRNAGANFRWSRMLTAMRQGTKPRRFFLLLDAVSVKPLAASYSRVRAAVGHALPRRQSEECESGHAPGSDLSQCTGVPGKSGQIRIYDAADNKLVDTLDLSIHPDPLPGPPGPEAAPYTPTPYPNTTAHPTNADTTPGTPSGAAVPTSRGLPAHDHRRIQRRVSLLSGDRSRQCVRRSIRITIF